MCQQFNIWSECGHMDVESIMRSSSSSADAVQPGVGDRSAIRCKLPVHVTHVHDMVHQQVVLFFASFLGCSGLRQVASWQGNKLQYSKYMLHYI